MTILYIIMGIVGLFVYLIIGIGVGVLYLRYIERKCPTLGIEEEDKSFALFINIFWPVALPVLLLHMYNPFQFIVNLYDKYILSRFYKKD